VGVLFRASATRALNETKKAADAADKSASAAERSSEAAQKSVALMRQRLDEENGLGNFRISSTIESAIAAIEAILQPQSLRNAKVPASLSVINGILEQEADAVMNHAGRMNSSAAKLLSAGFEQLRRGISNHRDLSRSMYGPGSSAYGVFAKRTQESFEAALADFRSAREITSGVSTSTPQD
jgi:glutamine synthetase adenylyltransferase